MAFANGINLIRNGKLSIEQQLWNLQHYEVRRLITWISKMTKITSRTCAKILGGNVQAITDKFLTIVRMHRALPLLYRNSAVSTFDDSQYQSEFDMTILHDFSDLTYYLTRLLRPYIDLYMYLYVHTYTHMRMPESLLPSHACKLFENFVYELSRGFGR